MLSQDIRYLGVNDHAIDLFEGQFPVPHGMSYNSYAILDTQIAVMDTVDARFAQEWLDNLRRTLDGRSPDYLVVQHVEPDHSGSLLRFLEAYPDAKVVASARAFPMLQSFFHTDLTQRRLVAGEGDTLSLGRHTLRFLAAPLVHWPEVLMTYDETAQVLFSADAFGKFGALDVPEPWDDEARRYYVGVVGKFGTQVQAVLKKLAGLELQAVCPLHGPVLTESLDHCIGLYDRWSAYLPEEDGILIAYTSVYGNTRRAVAQLADALEDLGTPAAATLDLSRCDMSQAVAEAFRYQRLVLATTTYNGDIFPSMREFLDHLTARGFRSRTIAMVENGSWGPAAARIMRSLLEKSRDLTFVQPVVTIRSAPDDDTAVQLRSLAEALCGCPSPE